MSDPTLGQVPSHWAVTSLGAVCKEGGGSVQTGPFGSQLHARDYVDYGIPSIMPLNIGDNRIIEDDIKRITNEDAVRLSKYRVRPGDIVYSRRGDVERHALVRSEQDGWLCGTGCLRVRFGDGDVVPEFASFYLDHPYVRQWIVRHAVGATMPNLNTKIMSAVPFVVPPKSEQKAIANILGTLDDKIELNRRMNETLESIARAIFKSWFVDFDPVRAKLEGQSHEQQSSASAYPMPAEVYDLFPSAFQDSELGKIPEGWEVCSLGDTIEINHSSVRKNEIDGEILYTDIASVSAGKRESPERLQFHEAPSRARRRVQNGDTIWSCVRPNRRSFCYIYEPEENLLVSTGFAVLSPRRITANYLYFLTSNDEFVHYLTNNADGSAYPAVRADHFAQAEVVVPSSNLLDRYEDFANPLRNKIALNERESLVLELLRDTLLPKLLSGELSIPDALLQAEEAL